MLDLETLGIGPDAAIVSIGACVFDLSTGQILEKFHQKVDFTPSMGQIDPSTVLWWFQQSEEARTQLLEGPRFPLIEVLRSFRDWATKSPVDGLWSNGPTFDEVIIRSAFKRLDVHMPISFRASRCCRTFFMLARELGIDSRSQFIGTKHNALDDAIYQAGAVSDIYNALTRKPGVEL